jgi:hypothetical protein
VMEAMRTLVIAVSFSLLFSSSLFSCI